MAQAEGSKKLSSLDSAAKLRCKCAMHPEETAQLFCVDCDKHQLACLLCFMQNGKHAYHRIVTIDAGRDIVENEIRRSGQRVLERYELAKENDKKRLRFFGNLNRVVSVQMTELDQVLDKLIRDLEKFRLDMHTALLRAAQSVRSQSMSNLKQSSEAVRSAILQLQTMNELLHRSISHVVESKNDFVKQNEKLTQILVNLSWKEPTSSLNWPQGTSLKKQTFLLGKQVGSLREDSHNLFVRKTKVRDIIVIAGGSGKSPNNTSVEVYDSETDRWAIAAPMAVGRYWTAAAILHGRVVVAGGRNASDEAIKSVEQFDPETNSWTSFPSLLVGRNGHSLVNLRDTLYAISGWDVKTFLDSVERYNAQTKQWEGAPPLTMPRYGFTSAPFENKVLVAGGFSNVHHSSCEVFDSDRNTWIAVAPLNVPRAWAAAATHNNVVYVFGGKDSANRYLDVVEQYDNASNKWVVLPLKLSVARWGLSASSLNGRVYIVGGRNDGSQNLVECFDANKMTLTCVLPASQARVGSAIASVSVTNFALLQFFGSKADGM